jgi:hypothetical protein
VTAWQQHSSFSFFHFPYSPSSRFVKGEREREKNQSGSICFLRALILCIVAFAFFISHTNFKLLDTLIHVKEGKTSTEELVIIIMADYHEGEGGEGDGDEMEETCAANRRRPNVLITGTPGCGKTTTAMEIAVRSCSLWLLGGFLFARKNIIIAWDFLLRMELSMLMARVCSD